jgi:hypothetical protein
MMRPATLLLFVVPAFSHGAVPSMDGKDWLAPPPASAPAATSPIPSRDVCEVVASKQLMAVLALHPTTIVRLDPAAATSYAGFCAGSGAAKSFYLARAVFGQGGTGAYSVSRLNDDLLVQHGSLGRTATYTKSALVVSLPYTPKHVFISASTAE